MFFLPNPINFPIKGTFPDNGEQLALDETSFELAYQPSPSDAPAEFKIIGARQVGSSNTISADWWRLVRTRSVGNLAFATLTFRAAAFIADAQQTLNSVAETRTLYDCILEETQIELLVQDLSTQEDNGSGQQVPYVTSLLVNLGYGSTAMLFSLQRAVNC
jgi:hypothetical protein